MATPAPAGGALGRLLIVNPNGNPVVSDLIRAAADRVLGPGYSADVIHPADSPISIEGPADRAEAEPRALALLANRPDYDAYVLACFDDIALAPARRVLRAPVVGAVEASLALARTLSERIVIVTTVEAAVPGIRALLSRYGAAEISVEAAQIGVAEAACPGANTERRFAEAFAKAVERADAGVAILGSAGLSGRAEAAGRQLAIPVIDCVEAAIRLGVAAMGHCAGHPQETVRYESRASASPNAARSST